MREITLRPRPWWQRVLRAPRTWWERAHRAWVLTRLTLLTLRRRPLVAVAPPARPLMEVELSPAPPNLPVPGERLYEVQGDGLRLLGTIETMARDDDAVRLTLSPPDAE